MQLLITYCTQSDALNTSLQEQNNLLNNMRDRIVELETVDETAQQLHRKLADVAYVNL